MLVVTMGQVAFSFDSDGKCEKVGIRLMLDNQVVMGAMDAHKSEPAQHIINKVL